jgi:glycosyltransferase involved in cell wall biosynthesis
MKHVGIDARLWQHTGIGRYIRNMVPRLAALGASEGLQITAWVAPGDLDAASELFQGVTLRPCPARPLSPQEFLFWPREWRHITLDLFHSPHLNIPLSGPPLVVTLHDLIPLHFPGTIKSRAGELYFRLMIQLATRRSARVLVHSGHTRDDMVALLGANPKKFRVVPLAADTRFSDRQPPERLEALRSRFALTGDYLLYAGQWKHYKNLKTLLSVFAALKTRHPGLQLVLAGRQDPSQSHVAAWITELALKNAVITPGVLDEDDLVALYQGARVFTFPSLYEGFGLPPLEAMAAGVPVVSSNAASLPEAVGAAALLVPPLDVLKWEQTVEAVLSDEILRLRLIQAGFERVQTLNWDVTARQTLAVYQEVLQGNPL